MPSPTHRGGRSTFSRLFLFALLALPGASTPPSRGAEPDAAKRQFDLPADTADKSLKRLAAQSGREILFPTEIVAGVRTVALRDEI